MSTTKADNISVTAAVMWKMGEQTLLWRRHRHELLRRLYPRTTPSTRLLCEMGQGDKLLGFIQPLASATLVEKLPPSPHIRKMSA